MLRCAVERAHVRNALSVDQPRHQSSTDSSRPLTRAEDARSARLSARRGRRRNRWLAAAVLLVVFGSLGSALAAERVAHFDNQRERSTFAKSADEVASTLTLSLQHEEDLVVSARSFITANPNVSEAAFIRWTASVEALARYPELEGGGYVRVVPRSQLPAFIARQSVDPASPNPAHGSFTVLPPGNRPYYCLLGLSFARRVRAATAEPAGLDYCAEKSDLRTALFTARDSGRNAVVPFQPSTYRALAIETPLYRGGVVPGTLAARRRQFLGAFGITEVPAVVLAAALRDRPGMAVEFRQGRSSASIFRYGGVVRGGQSATAQLPYGWVMTVTAPAIAGGLLHDSTALIILLGGIALSLLLALLVFVLGTGRARALTMVHEKTLEVSYLALHDALTGLPNRALALDRAERMLARARREPNTVAAALYVDIDRFKHVNDTFGHAAGDQLLKVVAARLSKVVRDQDTVARLGGDEFVVLLESATREAPPGLIADRVIEALREPVEIGDGQTTVAVSASVGIAIGPRASADELLRDADLALYTAKAAGKDRAVLFQASMQSTATGRLQLEASLEHALSREEFFLLYQPILALDTGEVVGVEALIRWRHPERGIVEPDDFIPLAEESGRIVPIGRWVLREACRQAAAWEAEGREIGMSVNISAHQLDRDGFVDEIRLALEQSGIQPSSLTLEITETALMRDVSAASERLKEIKKLGVRIAIDDFGTGSSSLSYLRLFSADSLKIDRSFISVMSDSEESDAIIHTLVELGKLLHIETLAEGIEDPEQLSQLRREHCDHGQGFLFARPVDAAGIERFLADGPVAVATPAAIR
jgi:diguanylate cyclase (GGDEF)-like protein